MFILDRQGFHYFIMQFTIAGVTDNIRAPFSPAKRNLHLQTNLTGALGEHIYPVTKEKRLLHIMGNKQNSRRQFFEHTQQPNLHLPLWLASSEAKGYQAA